VNKTFPSIYQFFLILFSIVLWVYFLGLDFINPTNTDWLFAGDLATYQIGWNFFRDDIWRFPIGSNPNLGIYYGGSIIFTDSLPLFAIFFKIFNTFLPENFQYFSLWILTCIYLQLFFSFKIIYKITNNFSYSVIGSLFFCFATTFLNRSAIHLSLMGQWIILSAFYIEIIDDKKKLLYHNINILLSAFINFYFTIILILFLFFQKMYDFFFEKYSLKKIFKEFVILLFSLILFMYVIGYFTIKLDDGLGFGYGYFNFNLNGLFNPTGSHNFHSFNWSFFLNELNFQNGEYEGFSYLGVSGIFFLLLFILNSILGIKIINFHYSKALLISVLFLILSTSNNINFGNFNIASIPINKFLYLFFSSIRASGRLIWPAYYLIFIFGIIIIFKMFEKKKPTLMITILLFLQIIDLSPGLLNYKFGSQYVPSSEKKNIKDRIWENLSKNFHQLRLLEPKNHSNIYQSLSKYLLNHKFQKTDVAYLGRVNRESVVTEQYKLIKLFNAKDLKIFDKTIFISDNINFVRNLYYLYNNNLKYYYRDNFWLIATEIPNEKEDIKDVKLLSNYYELDLDDTNSIEFNDINNLPHGMGWKADLKKTQLVAKGYNSSILFKIIGKKCQNNLKIKFDIEKNYINQKKPIEFDLILNQNVKEKIILKNNSKQFTYKFDCKLNDLVTIDFHVKKPLSLFDQKKGLNREKNSIILNSISIDD
jgi:hypothetical protein